ncbi:protein FAM110C [Saccopteryx leptura]|uniref:protein FAM110C n=1 Tax=Saccopteryx leptura TaxID=249018 RepID=UPI00339C4A6E
MRALPGLDAPTMERFLPRGPDSARPAGKSAVERLAADRAKYVRGQPGAARGPPSEGSSSEAGDGQAGDAQPPACATGVVVRRAIVRKPLRPDSLIMYRQKCEFVRGPGAHSIRGSLVRKLFPGPGKDKMPAPSETSSTGEEERTRNEEAAPTKPGLGAASAPPTPVVIPTAPLARSSVLAATPCVLAAPPARPIVRAAMSRVPAARPSVPAATPRVPAAPPVRPSIPAAPPARLGVPAAPRSPERPAARCGGLQRSQSDLSSRYSMSAAEFDTFFQFCGLEPEVVEALGRQNFSAGSDCLALKVRSVSVATSGSGFSRHSGGDEGLQEEELTEQVPSTTSVIERNARIIKWLYTCKKAKETPGPRLQDPA